MFGTKPRVSPLESRKRLLISESEINRVQLFQEWETVAEGVRGLACWTRSLGTTASSATALVNCLVTFTGGRSAPGAAKSSWVQKVASGAHLASTIWLAFRSRGSDAGKK